MGGRFSHEQKAVINAQSRKQSEKFSVINENHRARLDANMHSTSGSIRIDHKELEDGSEFVRAQDMTTRHDGTGRAEMRLRVDVWMLVRA
jgi:hypothetical protein